MGNKRLVWVLDSNGLLASEQCGFRKKKKRSTADHLVRFDTFICDAFAKKQQHVLAIFWLGKSLRHHVETRFTVRSLRSWFSRPFAYLHWGVSVPSAVSGESWLPLCPIRMSSIWVFLREASCLRFFSVLKLTILSSLSWKVWKRHYSWMILPFVYVQNSSHMHRLIQLCVNSVQDWVSKNGFKFSTSKTVCIHFCNQRKHFSEPSILLDKTPIKVVTEAKFLGVIFDRTSWDILHDCCRIYSSHVKYLKTNCLKALDILKVVGYTDFGADQKTLLCLYRALVRSKLDYGCIVYGAA